MPDKDIQDYDTIASADGADYALVIDASDTTDDPGGSLKKVLVSNGGAGGGTPQGSAKAWGWVSYSAGTPSFQDSYNMSSVDDDGTGDLGLNFTNDMADTTYGIMFGSDDRGSSGNVAQMDYTFGTKAAASFDAEIVFSSGVSNRTNTDGEAGFSVLGDLA